MVRLEVTIISTERMLLHIPSASSDYTAISRHLVFNGATRSQMVTVSIQDDMAVEDQFEQFFINLRNYWNDSAVILNGPTTASVTIEDNDGELSLDDCVSHYQFVLVGSTCFLLQWLQLDSMEPIQCVKMLVALMLLYLF